MKKTDEIATSCIIYCRVSTEDQVKGYSLESQERECRKFALNNYAVDKVFVERGESAKTQDRTEFQKLIKYAIQNKKRISALIIWKLNRLARNLEDQINIIQKFGEIQIRVLSVTDNNDNTSSGRLMRNVAGAFNQYENEVRGEATSNGMKEALKKGRWCWLAPVGYKNSRDINNKSTLVESEDGPFIKEAFKMAETGLYRQIHIANELKKKGFKRATANLVNRILRNPLYAGIIRVREWFVNDIDALHTPIVSKETFYKVQSILDGKRPSITPRTYNRPDFPLRNFVRCPKCGEKLTAGWSTGRRNKKYPYYHCRTKGCSLNVKRADLETGFIDYLKSFQPREDVLILFKATVLDVWENVGADKIKARHKIELELAAFQKERDRIEELKIKNVFDDATYQRRAAELTARIDQKQAELEDTKSGLCNDIEGCLEYCGFFISNVSTLWQEADLDLKQRFQALIFPDKIYYEDKAFRTTVTALIFKQLRQIQPPKSEVVAPWGFEPRSSG